MNELITQCFGLLNAAIDHEQQKISRRHRSERVASVPGNGDMTSLRPATVTPSNDVPPVANAGDGRQP